MTRTIALVLATSLMGCGSAGTPTCGTFTACGGDLTGTWKRASLCGTATDYPVPPYMPTNCATKASAIVTSPNYEVDTFRADGSFAIDGCRDLGSVALTFSFPLACAPDAGGSCAAYARAVNAQSGNEDLACTGTDQCTCTATSAIGCALNAPMSKAGTFTTSGSTLTLTYATAGSPTTASYCVSGDTLTTATPEESNAGRYTIWVRQ